MAKISPWIDLDSFSIRTILGADPERVETRVALIEKTPRVRIREAYHREDVGFYEDGGKYVEYRWAEWLDWCYGDERETKEESKQWCDAMLRTMGYEFPENNNEKEDCSKVGGST